MKIHCRANPCIAIKQIHGSALQPSRYMVVHCNQEDLWWCIATKQMYGGALQPSRYMVVHCNQEDLWWCIATKQMYGGALQPSRYMVVHCNHADIRLCISTKQIYDGALQPCRYTVVHFIYELKTLINLGLRSLLVKKLIPSRSVTEISDKLYLTSSSNTTKYKTLYVEHI